MRQLLDGSRYTDRVTIGHILHNFGVRGFAFLLLILALLNIVIFMVPFVSLVFGVPMVILAVQMVLGLHTPVFPQFIRHQSIPAETLTKGLEKAIGWVVRLERYIRPRFSLLTDTRLNRVHGVLAVMLAIMVTLPIPFINIPPSLGLAALAIGLLQRDGLFIIVAYLFGAWSLMLFRSLGSIAHSLT